MRKKKLLFVGIAIGVLARPIIVLAYRPFRDVIRTRIYNVAFEYIQNFDADRPS